MAHRAIGLAGLAVALVLAAGGTAAAVRPSACTPAGARVVEWPVVRWHGAFYYCSGRASRLAPLWLPGKVKELGRITVGGHYVAYAYYRDIGCDNATVGVRSQNWYTGATGYRIHSYGPCYDVYSWYVRSLVLRPTTGALAAIRRKFDFEDGFHEDTVIKADSAHAVVLDQQDVFFSDEQRNPDRIVGGLEYRAGRVHWMRASGPRSAPLGG
jgi:hypothetical protein